MGRSKTLKFADNEARQNVVQPGKLLFGKLKGVWREKFFGNDNMLVLELACGRGEYTVGLARKFPDKNFIGVDIKGSRIWTGGSRAEAEGLQNVAFLRAKIQNLRDHFSTNEISDIWIIHPDPRPKDSDVHRRLTHPRFLEMYKEVLNSRGVVRVKTDNEGIYRYTLEILRQRKDIEDLQHVGNLDKSDLLKEHHGILTRYEEQFKAEGHKIKYIKFRFSNTGND